eukprot:TRINITY_DN100_c0_g3_i1.p2 TRINITY_DN100_c0_g3~~TRINITY_DN100_c0_g3_i1.p2  ORF type:complete len:130 (+),score=15.87 TRINITY_DN100_c0_g3_i1:190-579(+)
MQENCGTKEEHTEDHSNKVPKLTFDCLITEIVDLLDSTTVNEHEKAKLLLVEIFKKISFRNGAELLSKHEYELYNLVRNLINRQEKINEWVLDYLKNISTDGHNENALPENTEIQKLRQRIKTKLCGTH